MSLYLRRVQISNFRTFGEFTAELPATPGVLILSGANGLGKSSFFDALEWGLTGSVLRFERFLKKGDTEENYLSREGTEPFSHHVRLSFNSGEPITRRGHRTNGPVGSSADEVIRLLVRPEWDEAVTNLSTYLGLTHFLGQASYQRFMYRQAAEQWKALRVPTGVERLEQIRLRLRGKGTQQAFNRREEEAALYLNLRRGELATWDGLVQRFRRAEATATAAGVLTREEILERVHKLRGAVANTAGRTPAADTPADVGESLIKAKDELSAARRVLEGRRGVVAGVEKVPDWYAERELSIAALTKDSERLSAERATADAERAELRDAMQEKENAVSVQRKRHQRANERVHLLEATQQDTLERAAAVSRIAMAEESIETIEAALAETRLEQTKTEAAVEQLKAARLEADSAERRFVAATALGAELAALDHLRAARDAAAQGFESAVEALRVAGDVTAIERDLTASRTDLQSRDRNLALMQERTNAIAAAVAAIAAHLTEHDRNCPVCRTEFPEGVLRQLVGDTTSHDLALLDAQTLSDQARHRVRTAEALLDAARNAAETHRLANFDMERATAVVVRAQRELATKLGIGETDDVVGEVALRIQTATREQQDHLRALVEREASADGVELRLEQLTDSLARQTAQLAAAKGEHSRVVHERTIVERRLASRLGDEEMRSDDPADALAMAVTERGQADLSVAEATKAFEDSQAAVSLNKQTTQRLDAEMERLTATRDRQQKERDALAMQWQSAGLALPPSTTGLVQAVAGIERRLNEIRTAESTLTDLVAAIEAVSKREELEGARRAVVNEAKGVSLEDHRKSLEQRIQDAEQEAATVRRAHAAVERLAERLQSEADAFSETILRPLNSLIGTFNDALLTTPGTAVAFNADYFKNRTEFSMLVRRKTRSGQTVNRNVNPQLLLSEGQLAANGFSILCSASTSYRWSTWRALLLDDPLQHNDVIHMAAFADVMRNLVSLEGYQVIMSSHDSAETDFIERKFTAAALPCVVIRLLGDAPDGIRYDTKVNVFARAALDGPSEKTAS